jgi:hypothetical protein
MFSKPIPLVLLLLLILTLLYPFKVTVVPVWRIQVVYASGKPVPSVGVEQVWQHYSVELDSHYDESITDEDGYVVFPERVRRISIFQRIIGAARNPPWFLHASSGPHSFILVLAGSDYLNDAASYDGRQPPPSRVILRLRAEIPPFKE